jgi:RimJ/RimL family protein N-acetyltransferase
MTAGAMECIKARNLTDEHCRALNVLRNIIHAERAPGEPPFSLEQTVAEYRDLPAFREDYRWLLWDEDHCELIGTGIAVFTDSDENRHLADFAIWVHPSSRRRGIATDILYAIAEHARRLGRTHLHVYTTSTVPAGEAFLRHFGVEPALEGRLQELQLAEVDRSLLRRWQARARERAASFTLKVWEGPPFPEEDLEMVAAMYDAANAIPHGELDIEEFHKTPEQIRALDESMAAQGTVHWTIAARDPETGYIAGFHDVSWNPREPEIVRVGVTAVFDEYRNRGLGRWLKAAMVEKVLAERPEVKRMLTGNATTNAPMLAINEELGFRVTRGITAWQMPVELVLQPGSPPSAPGQSA